MPDYKGRSNILKVIKCDTSLIYRKLSKNQTIEALISIKGLGSV